MADNQEQDDAKPVRITQKEIYSVITRMEKEIITLSRISKDVDDHEIRIRDLEKTVWKSSWVSGMVSAVFTSAATAMVITFLQSNA